ncbi:hypothetical protein AOQ84DRAFT_364067, partial [Glonium stellatum]
MPSRPDDTSWDFSPVLDLINNLSYHDENEGQGEVPVSEPKTLNNVIVETKEEEPGGLGNFSKIWEFLGVPASRPQPDIVSFSNAGVGQIQDKEAYNSDGAIYCLPANKGVKWRDQLEGSSLENIPQEEEDNGDSSAPLTRKQKKKQKKKAEKRLAKQQAESERLVKAASDFESEGESRWDKKAPAKKASVHYPAAPETPTPKSHRYNPRSRNTPSTPTPQNAGGLSNAAPPQFKILKLMPSKAKQQAALVSTLKAPTLIPSQLLTPSAPSTQLAVPLSAPAKPFQTHPAQATPPQLQTLQAQGIFSSPYTPTPHISAPNPTQPALQQPP